MGGKKRRVPGNWDAGTRCLARPRTPRGLATPSRSGPVSVGILAELKPAGLPPNLGVLLLLQRYSYFLMLYSLFYYFNLYYMLIVCRFSRHGPVRAHVRQIDLKLHQQRKIGAFLI